MNTDLSALKNVLKQKYRDTIVVSNWRPSILGHGEYPMAYDADILKAAPSGIQIYQKGNNLFRIELYPNDIHSHIETPWDWFGIANDITEDDIICIVGDLLDKPNAEAVYKYCHEHDKLTDRYCSPCVEVAQKTRKAIIEQDINAGNAFIVNTRQHKDGALLPKYMTLIVLPFIWSIIEIIGRYATLCDNNIEPTSEQWHAPGKSKQYFKAGLPSQITSVLNDDEQNKLYKNMRCGLLHAGEPVGNFKIGTYITTDIKNNTYNVYELWDLIKCRWSEICSMPTIHPTGGFAIIDCQYGDNANIIAI